ncbi:MAG: peptidyl-prolyl cis-trans isomerase [Acidobacteriota bacterium]|nr:peptidyl-prolyl cis-trans isomerase [Acidobacteriota bacterium]
MPRRLAILFVAFLITALTAAQTGTPATATGTTPGTSTPGTSMPGTSTPGTRKKSAAGQTAGPSAPASSRAASSGTAGVVGPSTPVMFVSGLCALQGANVPALVVPPRPGTPPGTCMRAVTKSQFEMLVAGLGPRAQQADKRQLAEYYVRGLLIDNEARKLKLEQDPQTAEAIWMGRIAALGEALHRHLQQRFANIPEADVIAYYNGHKNEFEEATIRRIVVPKPQQKAAVQAPPDKKPEATKAEDKATTAAPDSPSAAKLGASPELPYDQQLAARKAYSEKLVERAKAGEAFDKLQKDAFTVAGLQSAAPDTEAVAIHRGQLPPAHEEKIFALQAGQYSALIDEPSAYVFYKLESRRAVPLTEVREDIRSALRNQKEDEAIKQVFSAGKPNLNPAYFAPSKPEVAETPEAKSPEAKPDAAEPARPEAPKPEAPKPEAPK